MDRETARAEFSRLLKLYLDSGQRAQPYRPGIDERTSRDALAEALGRTTRAIRTWTGNKELPLQPELEGLIMFLFGEAPEDKEAANELIRLWRRARGLDRPSSRWSGVPSELPADELGLLWAVAEAEITVDDAWLRRLYGSKALELRARLVEKDLDPLSVRRTSDPELALQFRTTVIEGIADEVLAGKPALLSLVPLLDTREPQDAVKARRERVVGGVLKRLSALGLTPSTVSPRLTELVALARTNANDGFLAGNVINLLSGARGNLSQQDLTGLIIRHAHLGEVVMHDADLSGSRLIDCILADTFGSIWQVGFREGDREVLASSVTGQVRVFGVATATTSQVYGIRAGEHHRGWSFGFAEGHGLVASAGGDGQVLVWDQRGVLDSRLLGHQSRVRAVAILPDRSIVSCSEDREVYRWRRTFAGGQGAALYRHNDRATTLAVDAEGTLIVSGAGDGELIFHALTEDRTDRLRAHAGEIRCVRLSQDGACGVSIGDDREVRIWDATSRRLLTSFPVPTASKAVCFLGPSREDVLVGADDGEISIWRPPYRTAESRWVAHSNLVRSVASSSDGSLVASGGDDQTLQVWRLSDGTGRAPTLLRSYPGYLSQVRALAFVPSGQLASAHDDGQIHLWDLRAGEPTSIRPIKAHKGRIWSLGLLRNGELLVSAGEDGEIHAWAAMDPSPLQTWRGHEYRVFAVACRDNPTTLVASAGSDKSVKLWRLGEDAAIQTLAGEVGHGRRVRDVTFRPDGLQLASAGEDGRVIVWAEQAGQWVKVDSVTEERPVTSARFTPDGRVLVYVTDAGDLVAWEVAQGDRRRLALGTRPLLTVSISPDGSQAVAGSEDGQLHPVTLPRLEAMPAIAAHTDWVEQVLFSPDGAMFATASDDQEIHIYDALSRELAVGPLKARRPYEGLRIDRLSGLDTAELEKLLALGAIPSEAWKPAQERR